jgi:hypothetical protein
MLNYVPSTVFFVQLRLIKSDDSFVIFVNFSRLMAREPALTPKYLKLAPEASSSPDLPLASTQHNRTNTIDATPTASAGGTETENAAPEEVVVVDEVVIPEAEPLTQDVVDTIKVEVETPIIPLDSEAAKKPTLVVEAALPGDHAATDLLNTSNHFLGVYWWIFAQC